MEGKAAQQKTYSLSNAPGKNCDTPSFLKPVLADAYTVIENVLSPYALQI